MGVTIREKVKGSGEWWIFINHHGKRRSKKIGSKPAANKAAADVAQLLARKELGILENGTPSPTFYEYAAGWLENYIAPPMRSEATHRRYKTLLEQHIKQHIGSVPLTELSRKHCRDLLVRYYKSGASKSSVGLMLCVVSGALNHAVDDEIITGNPIRGIFRQLQLDDRQAEEIHPLSQTETAGVLNVMQDYFPQYYPFFLTAFRTGLRIGELCALKWDDINFREQYLAVRRTSKDQKLKETTKTAAGRRRVDMSDQLTAALRRHHKKWSTENMAAGGKKRTLVFQSNNKLLAQNTIRRVFDRALAKAGLDHRRVHDIRHTYATALLSNGTPLVYVKEQLGHRSINITVDIYGHWIPSSNRDAVNALDDKKTKTGLDTLNK